MKKLLALLATACCAMQAQAQIPNSGLESWHNYTSGGMTMTAPDGWISTDSAYKLLLDIKKPGSTYKPMVTRETAMIHSGSAAARLESKIQDDTTIRVAMMSLGKFTYDPGDPSVNIALGGIPIAGQVEKVSAWIRFAQADKKEFGMLSAYAIQDGTSYNGGDSLVGFGGISITASIPTYYKVEIPMEYIAPGINADRILFMFGCGIDAPFGTGSAAADGSVLYIDDLTMTDPLGIETPIFTGETVNIYPNPATDKLFINASTSGTLRLKLYTAMGKLVLQQEVHNNTPLDISNLASGNYMYQVTGADQQQLAAGILVKK